MDVVTPFASFKQEIGSKTIHLPKYAALAAATTPLVEREDLVSVAMVDSDIAFTPVEYGNVITTTRLVNLQTGGKSDLAAAALIGQNMSITKNSLAMTALEATSNVLYGAGEAADVNLDAGDVMTAAILSRVYNKLARTNVPKHPLTGTYIEFLHDDVIHDLRSSAAAGSWVDVMKYAQPGAVLAGEIGQYGGFTIVRNNTATITANVGAGAVVDVYKSSFFGFNGLGLVESMVPAMTITGPFDKLGRLVNLGWSSCMKYGIVDVDAVWNVHTSSSLANNAS